MATCHFLIFFFFFFSFMNLRTYWVFTEPQNYDNNSSSSFRCIYLFFHVLFSSYNFNKSTLLTCLLMSVNFTLFNCVWRVLQWCVVQCLSPIHQRYQVHYRRTNCTFKLMCCSTVLIAQKLVLFEGWVEINGSIYFIYKPSWTI